MHDVEVLWRSCQFQFTGEEQRRYRWTEDVNFRIGSSKSQQSY